MAEILVVDDDDIRETLQGAPELQKYPVGTPLLARMRGDDLLLASVARSCGGAGAAASPA